MELRDALPRDHNGEYKQVVTEFDGYEVAVVFRRGEDTEADSTTVQFTREVLGGPSFTLAFPCQCAADVGAALIHAAEHGSALIAELCEEEEVVA